jgi:hypothetical protein
MDTAMMFPELQNEYGQGTLNAAATALGLKATSRLSVGLLNEANQSLFVMHLYKPQTANS